jgi:hypothetical protein
MLARYARPSTVDNHGRAASEVIPVFELAPISEMGG